MNSLINNFMENKVRNINIKENSIFVSIASYRDDECEKTIKSLFDNAKNKNDIYILKKISDELKKTASRLH